MPKLGAYSKEIILARPDGRTKEARLLGQVRLALTEHLGGDAKVGPPQRLLIERAAHQWLRCAKFDQKFLAGDFTKTDYRVSQELSNALTRTLKALGLEGMPAAARTPSLDDHIAGLRRSRHGDAAA